MGVPGSADLMVLATAAQAGGTAYPIEQSLRFDGSSHLNFTPSSTASTRRQMTFSFWAKHDGTYNIDNVFSSGTASYYDSIVFDSTTCATSVANSGATGLGAVLYPAARLRDPSAWLHYVMVLDTPNPTAADRLRIYINGERVTNFASSPYSPNADPGQNYDTKYWNTTATHRLGCAAYSGSPDRFFSGYLAEVYCVFGSALDPTSFGQYDNNGVWRPIGYTGSYGTNGFYLKFDPTATNGIGHDHSGNGNHFTPSGFTTTGINTDVFSDTPTANEATWNPLYPYSPIAQTTNESYSEGNKFHGSGRQSPMTTFQTIAVVPGMKVTMELDYTNVSGFSSNYGACNFSLRPASGVTQHGGEYHTIVYYSGHPSYPGIQGPEWVAGGSNSTGTIVSNSVLGVIIDRVANTIRFYVNGSAAGDGSLSTAGQDMTFWVSPTSATGSSTFSDAYIRTSNFEYTYPDEYIYNTAAIPEPAIKNPGKYFKTLLYTGDGTNSRGITGLGFQPDFVWIKRRDTDIQHEWMDSVRGAGDKALSPHTGGQEGQGSTDLSSFDSDGFTINSGNDVNANGASYVAWCWKAGGTASTLTAGSINSSVSASPTSGFSIVTYTGNGTTGATVAHGLGVKPDLIIVKRRTTTSDWAVYHSSLGATKYMSLNNTNLSQSSSAYWNNSEPTDTVFSLGISSEANTNGGTCVAYCFAEVPGFSKFSEFQGNGSNDGAFEYLGFRPAFVMFKRHDASGESWHIHDSARYPYNRTSNDGGSFLTLSANNSDGESGADNRGVYVDFLSNGFKIRSSAGFIGGTVIYAAFAEHPFGGEGVTPAPAR